MTAHHPRRRPKVRFAAVFLVALSVVATASLTPHPARAQQAGDVSGGMVMRIAAVVNDEVISVYDIEARTRILIASSGIPDTPEVKAQIRDQVLRSLIDETLKIQAAERLGQEVTEDDMRTAIGQVEAQNGIPPGGFEDFIQVTGLDRESALRQIEAEVAWIKAVRARFRNQVDISDDQVDIVLGQLEAAQGKPEHLAREIFLPVDNPADEARVRANAEQLLAELRRGASFAAVARQFSRSPTAANGGSLGWVRAGELDPALEQALLGMQPKTLSDPVRTVSGYHILYLAERRRTAQPQPDKARLTISQIVMPSGGPNAMSASDQAAIAAEVAAGVDSCEAFNAIATSRDLPNSGPVGTLAVASVDQPVRGVLMGMEVGEVSDPVDVRGGKLILMLCDRSVPGGMPSREAIRDRLYQQRLELVSNRYLRTLRQQAVIDLRI
ncbi:peptidylprolyl isomerase [Roseospira visakhapatnamensis]|uniref:Parvulin-like PPIase n=1 Tax=Roseospira visakhapatnamensis TaxID=390880 RepID=A0A7W6RBY7_9PROT|nr:peptidyl-prolyl cis-trans isomerase SurA [Roseospira visakhapatnamensis]